jgi:threonine dehydrogenase-like Zn-dependent dehydrogenase
MEYLKDGTFDTKFLVTHRVKLEDFPELYNAFDKRYAGKSSSVRQVPKSIDFNLRCK